MVDLALVLERRLIAQPDLLGPAREVGRGDPEVDLVRVRRRCGLRVRRADAAERVEQVEQHVACR